MTARPHRLLATLALTLALGLAAAPVAGAADALGTAKATGQVGERPDGLLGPVGSPAPAVSALIERINAERLARYREAAGRSGRPLAEVQAVAGLKLIEATPAGQYVLDAAGRWRRK